MAKKNAPLNEPVVAGPFILSSASLELEFLEPDPSRNATVLMRAVYKHDHPLCKKGKGHPQAPPLHLHFDQYESYEVFTGSVGTTADWSATDRLIEPKDGVQCIPPWKPHRFWPDPDSKEDCTILLWAHPTNVPEPMDRMFFQSILMYISDVSEKKASLDPLQIMLTQHASATALVWFPTVSVLGPLRWWIPYQVQAVFAFVARLLGRQPLMKQYLSDADWKQVQRLKKE